MDLLVMLLLLLLLLLLRLPQLQATKNNDKQ
jgi:competence protein ComGC